MASCVRRSSRSSIPTANPTQAFGVAWVGWIEIEKPFGKMNGHIQKKARSNAYFSSDTPQCQGVLVDNKRTLWVICRMVQRGMILLALIVLLLSGCGSKKGGPEYYGSTQMINDKGILYALGDSEPYTGSIIDYHPNGVKSYKVEVKQGVPQGAATEWYKSGQKMTETKLENGKVAGIIKGWYRSGKKEYEMPIKNGEIDGIGIEYYENGAKKSEAPYVKGSRNGRERGYAEAGHKLWEADWRDDQLHGDYIEFYASGKTNSLTPYVTGINNGTSTGWHETGEKAWQAKWNGKKPVGTHYEWFPNGKLKRQQSFTNGKLIMISEWYANGQKTMEASYSNGKLTAQKRWNPKGKLVIASGTSASPTVVGKRDPDQSQLKPNPNSPGRRKVWNTVQLSKIYTGKPSTTVQATFGLPDIKRGDTWVYGNMSIIDPTTQRRFNTANFLIQNGKVLLVEAN